MRGYLIATLLCLGLTVSASPAPAEEFTAGGLRFSDELGGFRLISVTGSGTASDPIVVVEEITQGIRAHLPGLVRVSFGCYNDEVEVDWFVEVLEKIVHGEYKGRYVQDPVSGAFWAEGYTLQLAPYFSL